MNAFVRSGCHQRIRCSAPMGGSGSRVRARLRAIEGHKNPANRRQLSFAAPAKKTIPHKKQKRPKNVRTHPYRGTRWCYGPAPGRYARVSISLHLPRPVHVMPGDSPKSRERVTLCMFCQPFPPPREIRGQIQRSRILTV